MVQIRIEVSVQRSKVNSVRPAGRLRFNDWPVSAITSITSIDDASSNPQHFTRCFLKEVTVAVKKKTGRWSGKAGNPAAGRNQAESQRKLQRQAESRRKPTSV